MMIKREDIIGAKIHNVYTDNDTRRGLNYTTVYFKTDRGFSFILPMPGHDWTAVKVPILAKMIRDNDVAVKRMKDNPIVGVFCERQEEGYEYEPDECFILLKDETRVSCRSCAPEGISTGLILETKSDSQDKLPIIDVFDIPRRKCRAPGFSWTQI